MEVSSSIKEINSAWELDSGDLALHCLWVFAIKQLQKCHHTHEPLPGERKDPPRVTRDYSHGLTSYWKVLGH